MTGGRSPYTPEYVEVLLGREFLQAMALRGKQHKFTPEVWAKVLHATFLGFNVSQAAPYAGIGRHTVGNWCKEYPELEASLAQAAPAGGVYLAERLEAEHDPLIDRWRLERMSESHAPPAKRTEHKITGEIPKVILERHEGLSVPVPPEISGVEEESGD